MRIYITSVFVDDQAKAAAFYTGKLGFEIRHDIDMGGPRWLTVVSPQAPEGPELLLEPSDHRAVGPYKGALKEDGIPAASFMVDDLKAEVARLKGLGVTFTQDPVEAGPARTAVLDDTCGNLIQLVEMVESP